MALLAEELVEEWLNRLGYFTIRGIKLGVHEIDLLAVRLRDGEVERRHIEVQASVRPVSYITRVPTMVQQATGRSATSAKSRTDAELAAGIDEWVTKKYDHPAKRKLRRRLCPGEWTRELVVHVVKYPRELELLEAHGIVVHRLADVVTALKRGDGLLQGAAAGSLADLVAMTARAER